MRAATTPHDPLARYRAKRDFAITGEPAGEQAESGPALSFVIQKHAASRLHYDFRLELDGVLVSWAVPKGPSFDPADKRMAIHVEDHPLAYGGFEGTIPKGQYGAGTVIVWDRGTWEPVGDPREGLAKGKLVFWLNGHKLSGLWELVKIAKGGERQEPWLLFKKRDDHARLRGEYDVVTALPDSVIAHPIRPELDANVLPASAGQAATGRKAAGRKAAAGAPQRDTPSSSAGSDAIGHKQAAATLAGAAAQAAAAASPGGIAGSVKAPMPESVTPQLATLAEAVPAKGQWRYELKFDGYRLMARVQRGKASLITRGGHDWSDRMPALVQAIEALGVRTGWLDGEIVVLGEGGSPDFNALQKAFDRRGQAQGIVYFLFDVPYLDGWDLRGAALSDRRSVLKSLLSRVEAAGPLRFSEDFEADPSEMLESACRMGMEGVIAKRQDATYQSTRTETWLKLKCKRRQEFVVCGYTDRSDGSPQIGSLVLGVYSAEGELVSVGSVGTGWNAEEARMLKKRLAAIETGRMPFPKGAGKPGRWSRRAPGSERWVDPVLVAEVEFAEWTPDGQIRHSAYVGLREDKPAGTVVRESARPAPAGAAAATKGPPTVAGVKVTNADRVVDPSTRVTKLELVRYYESVADFILPHLKGRPCSLVRGPEGVGGELFFQKHGDKIGIPHITELDPALWPGHDALLQVDNVQALVGAAQLNVIEFHTWNARSRRIDQPDRIVFDLDPGEGTTWQHVQEAAVLVRTLLQELGLASWLKTSGGKGLHVVVPLTPRHGWDDVKGFSQAVVRHLAGTIPSRFVARSGAANRVGKLFVDYLRNGHGATTAAAFSARARPGLGVSMPVAWDQLSSLKSGAQWTVATAREYLSFQQDDPWVDYWAHRQTLTKAMKALGFTPGLGKR